MSRISEKASNIFGFLIKEGSWNNYLKEMDIEGEPTRVNIGKLLFALCQEVEDLEKEQRLLKTSVGGLNVKTDQKG